MKIGVIGYSAQKFDEQEALEILRSFFSTLPTESEIVVGYTDLGIPGLAVKVAREFGFKVRAVANQKDLQPKYANNHPDVDVLVTDDEWVEREDESPWFVDYVDKILRIGGGNQSKNEQAIAGARGKEVIYHELFASFTLANRRLD